jgi:hypothetical protein
MGQAQWVEAKTMTMTMEGDDGDEDVSESR